MQRAAACGGSGAPGLAWRFGIGVRRCIAVTFTFAVAGHIVDGSTPGIDAAAQAHQRATGGQFAVACVGDLASASESGLLRRLRDGGPAEPEL